MSVELKLVAPAAEASVRDLDPETRNRHLRNVTASMLANTLDLWADIQGEFEGVIHSGNLVEDRARNGFVPSCGWPEFLEKMRILEHHLAHTQRIVRGD